MFPLLVVIRALASLHGAPVSKLNRTLFSLRIRADEISDGTYLSARLVADNLQLAFECLVCLFNDASSRVCHVIIIGVEGCVARWSCLHVDKAYSVNAYQG